MQITYEITSSLQFARLLVDLISTVRTSSLPPSCIETLAQFLSLPPKYKHFPFSPQGRAIVMKNMDIPSNLLQNKIHILIKKGYIVRDTDGALTIPKALTSLYEQFIKNKTLDLSFLFVYGEPELSTAQDGGDSA